MMELVVKYDRSFEQSFFGLRLLNVNMQKTIHCSAYWVKKSADDIEFFSLIFPENRILQFMISVS